MSLRVVFASLVNRDPNSGTAGWMERLAEALRDEGIEAECLFAEDINSPLFHLSPNLSAIVDGPIALLRRLAALGKSGRPVDIVELWDPAGYLAILGHKRRLVKSLGEATFVLNRSVGIANRVWKEHLQYGDIYETSWKTHLWYPRLLGQERLAFKHADAAIVASSIDYEFATKEFGPTPTIKGPPAGVESPFLERVPNERPRDVLFVGSWIRRKGADVLPGIIEQVHRLWKDFTLTIVGAAGDGVLEQFPQHLKPLVRIVENIPSRRVLDEYRRHKILLLPSRSEGFVRVVTEAMATGMAVVATRVGGASDMIEDGKNGFLVEPRDWQTAAARVVMLLQDDRIRERVSRAAVEQAESFTWRTVAKEVQAIHSFLKG